MRDSVRIRGAVADDVAAMFDIRLAVRENATTIAALQSVGIDRNAVTNAITTGGRGWIVEDHGRAAGFSMATNDGLLFALFVRPEFERRGYGSLLLQRAVDWLHARGVSVVRLTVGRDTPACRFYLTRGWSYTGRVGQNGDVELQLVPGASERIRAAQAEDVEAIARVHVETWQSAYKGIIADDFLSGLRVDERAASWREQIVTAAQRRGVILVAGDQQRVLGFISGGVSRPRQFGCDAELYALYVSPSQQGKGIGRRLLRALAVELATYRYSTLVVGVLEKNAAGRRFYESLGATEVGRESLDIAGVSHVEVFYAWKDLEQLG